MCNFFSLIVERNGNVIWDEGIDHHDELLEMGKLKDNTSNPTKLAFARVEITPPDGDVFANIKKWELRIDQTITPTWWSKTHEVKAWNALKECLKKVLIKRNVKSLKNRKRLFIKADVDVIKNCQNIVLSGNSTVSEMYDNSTVSRMYGNSTVSRMYDNSTVSRMYGNSTVSEMSDNSTVSRMYGNSTVSRMYGNSTVSEMYGNSTVSEMSGNSTVSEMSDNSTVSRMYGNSTVSRMSGNSTVSVYSSNVKYAIIDKSNGIVILRYDDLKVVHAKGTKAELAEVK